MMTIPNNSHRRSLDRQSVQDAAGMFACIMASAPELAAESFVVGGSMDYSAMSQQEGSARCSVSTFVDSNFASDISSTDSVSAKAPASAELQVVAPKKGRKFTLRSPMRLKKPNTAGHTVAHIVRAAAANSMEFNVMCQSLVDQATRAFPEVSNDIEDLMQVSILQALTCDAVPLEGDAAAFLSKRLFSRIRDFKRTLRTRARIQNLNYEEMSAGIGRTYAGLDLSHNSAEDQMINAIHGFRMSRRALKFMSGRERLAFGLFTAGNKAAMTGLHRHSLRRALAKVETMVRK